MTHPLSRRQILLDLLRPYRLRIVFAFIALLVAAVSVLLIGQGLRQVIDKGFVAGSAQWLNYALLGTLVVILVMAVATYARFYLVSWLGERITADLRRNVFSHLLTLSPEFFEQNRTGDVLSRLTNDTTQLETVIGSSVSMALRNALLLLGGLVMLAITSLKLTLLVLLAIPFVLVPIIMFGRRVRKLARATQDSVADVGAYTDEVIHEIRTVQAYGHEAESVREFNERVESTFATGIKRIRQRALLVVAVITLVFSAIALILWVGGHDVLSGAISAGELSAFIFYAVIVASAMGTISEVIGDVQRAAGATERLVELLATQSSLPQAPHPLVFPGKVRGEISMRGINFAYPSRPDTPVFTGFDLQINPGEKIALVGQSGAGKTTVFQLLQRFYDPQAGEILLDGINIKEADIHALRSHIAVVPQDPVIFAASLRDNLRYARPDATDAEVIAACEAAFAMEFIAQLPEGLDSFLGERGVRLSGGQKQRIAIARAILADRPILLLDEATSALDSNSEQKVQQALETLMQNRTTIMIAHRLSTVVNADKILVLQQGNIVASGTHQALLASSELYQQLARLQFQREP
ncbi:ABC transporter transmembrane domain-containing protein [Cellvibrio sp. pealriver]|uniref:ABC transporter transmembrane domain-containing protein n=1 Tax=Cellvibrio sp. pealriver TaxID=1622269 RepID=UPI00066FF103|nr:ABC transporter transmembrane domain-containing protein [Cellvibrio sp. pealriver]